jgi:hypothetical protein
LLNNKKNELNNMTNITNNITEEMELTKLSKLELLAKCQDLGFTKYKTKNKCELIDLINSKNTQPKKVYLIIEDEDEDEDDNTQQKQVNVKHDLLQILNDLLTTHSLKYLANELNVATGTITRWIELNDIPKNYEFDILKLSNTQIIYSNYSSKEKDQFFTPLETAQKCFQIFTDVIKPYDENPSDFKYIEPSAGDGTFLQVLPPDTIALDIEPRHPSIINFDYLNWYPSESNNFVVFGNPPFGLRGHMALKFINHSYEFADYVCFILPQLFESDGKGSPRKRVTGYNLIHNETLSAMFYSPDETRVKVNGVFQIWSKFTNNSKYDFNKG